MSWTASDIPDQTGRVVIITGANSGLGYESAIALARKGAQVIMACRSVEKAEQARQNVIGQAPSAVVELMPLDLGSLDSVRAFADAFSKRCPQLHILMNNAGVMVPPPGKTADGFELQIGTNHMAHFALTGLLMPHLLNTPGSRVVTVSSSAYTLTSRINFDDIHGERSYQPWNAYSQSKLANVLFSQELQRKLDAAGAGVISVSCHPGYTLTNLQKQSAGFMNNIMFQILRPIASQPIEVGARYQLYAATAPDVHGGEFFGPRHGMRGEVARLDILPHGRDTAAAARLWKLSEEMTGVHYEALAERASA